MSLSSTTTRVQYAGNGSTTAFPITFAFWSADDLTVILSNDTTAIQTTWVRATNYTVSGGSGSTGTLTATTAPASGYTLTIISALPNTQLTELPSGGPLPSTDVEQQFDKDVRMVQQVSKRVDRALVQPDADAVDIDRLPAKVSRASMFLAFDADGDPIASPGATAVATPVSSFAATLLDDADAATARATLVAAGTGVDNAFTADQTIASTDAGAGSGPTLKLFRNSASPAASDAIGAVEFPGRNSTPATVTYGRVRAVITDATAASEDAQVDIQTMVAGTLTTILTASVSGLALKGNYTKQIAQIVSTETGVKATGTTVTPLDDTIPQKTEGDEYMTLAITPKSASSTLFIDVRANASASLADDVVMALHQDSASDALAATAQNMAAGAAFYPMTIHHTMTSGTTSATTFKIRIGKATAGTITFNGAGGSRLLGGVLASSIVITEILP